MMSDHLKAISLLNSDADMLKTALLRRKTEESKAATYLAEATRQRERVESELRSVEYTIATLTPPPVLAPDEEDDLLDP